MSPRSLSLICLLVLVATPYCAVAQDGARREKAIEKLIQIQVEKGGALLDDNALDALILRFRKVNPDASEDTWGQIKSEVKALFLRLLSEMGGPFSSSVREVMPQFTTDDIERLAVIHSDPLFIKYSDAALSAMKKPGAELAMRMAIERSVVEMNGLVSKRGLKPAY
jgi:hypothetical protein